MKTYCFKPVLLLLLLFFPLAVTHAVEVLKFGVVDDEPPISSAFKGSAVGIVPEVIRLVFAQVPGYQVELHPYPWARAQTLVEQGELDGLLTYPSEKRKKYAVFSHEKAYSLDFSYLIYHKASPHRLGIEAAESFKDLAAFKIITQMGVEWEQDNIPKELKRVEANNLETMIHLLLLRKAGDFFVMMPEQATYLATKFGYQDELAYRRVDFIPDSNIPFHIGVRKSHHQVNNIIFQVDSVLRSDNFRRELGLLTDRFR